MSSFTYLQHLAETVSQKRYNAIEVFNEGKNALDTKAFQLYKLARDPNTTSKQIAELLFPDKPTSQKTQWSIQKLIQRTVTRLENLLLLTDPDKYSDDEETAKRIAAVRSIVTGLFLAQNGIRDGAVFHLRKGLKRSNVVPAEWQGFCIAGLRYMAFYHSLHGARAKTVAYHNQLRELTDAVNKETTLRSQHDVLHAYARNSTMKDSQARAEWEELHRACQRAIHGCTLPWFIESVTRISNTALQATGRNAELLDALSHSPLPRREVALMSAVCSINTGRISDAFRFAKEARTLFRSGSANWYISTDVAVRASLLVGNAAHASMLLSEVRKHRRIFSDDSILGISQRLMQEYSNTFENLRKGTVPRKGRPSHSIQYLREHVTDASLSRHYHVALCVWVLMDSMLQQHYSRYDEMLKHLSSYVARRKDLRTDSRLAHFVQFLVQHQTTPPSKEQLRDFVHLMDSNNVHLTDSEIIRYEIVAPFLVKKRRKRRRRY